MRALLEAGADVTVLDEENDTALNWASSFGNTDCVYLLLGAAGTLIDSRNGNGSTALHDACENGHFATAAVLIGAGADRTILDNGGQRARDVAATDGIRALLDLADAQM